MTEDDKYEVLEKIGQGSFGVIRRVKRKSDGQVLCRKEISYMRMSPKEREQLQAELSILKELRHPNIVAYYERDHIKATSDLYLYMEYCGNGDLGMTIRTLKANNQYVDEEFVWSIFAQLVTALYRCHYGEDPPEVGRNVLGLGNNAKPLKSKQAQYMILHRDLKPENVFLGTDNSVKLGDFGLSKILASHDFASTYVGTPFYMSPEICAAERYTLYSDIWSLGCIIYELCAKEPPFNARTHFDLVQKIKAGRVPPLPSVYSPELQKVIDSCLQVSPSRRPDTAQLLNLPAVKLMRKELEVVKLGQRLKAEKELASKSVKEANARLASLDAEKEAMRLEIDAVVRREWEVKARLEIDRQIQLELERLRKTFESEVSRRVEEEVERRIASIQAEKPSAAQSDVRSSTPTNESQEVQHASFSTLDTASDFPSTTDLSSLSLDSPTQEASHKPLKRSTRTPFTRAHTMFAAGAVDSPMDTHMADPSPMSIASLSLSPRRNGTTEASHLNPMKPARNIFAAAAERWEPLNASSPSNASQAANEDDNDTGDEDLPVLPSPTRNPTTAPPKDGDPFKAPAPASALPHAAAAGAPLRPPMMRQKTMPANPARLASAPNLFGPNALAVKARGGGGGAAANGSAVPVVATSPTRPKSALSPSRRAPRAPVAAAGTGSPVRKGVSALLPAQAAAASGGGGTIGGGKEGGAGAGVGAGAGAGGGLRTKKGNEEMIRTAMRNQLQGRTLVELAQARTSQPINGGSGGGSGEKGEKGDGGAKVVAGAGAEIKVAAKIAEATVWDPERDEMPSPFLVKTGRGIRTGVR